MRATTTSLGFLILCAVQADAQTADLPLCQGKGAPSFVATRTITSATQKITARVFVANSLEREETQNDGETTVKIVNGTVVTVYNLQKKTGFSVSMTKAGKPPIPKKDDPNFRIAQDTIGDDQVVTWQARNGSAWTDIFKVTCRKDGVVLRQEFQININNTMVPAVLIHTDIEMRDLPAELFEIPQGVAIKVVPPPPPPPR